MNHLVKFNELKEWKVFKPYHPYGSKNLKISKLDLELICNYIDIDFSKIKHVGSGKFGDAYSIDNDIILKITGGKNEAETAWNSIGIRNPYIVKYYGVWKYKQYYVLLMDKTIPFTDIVDENTRELVYDFTNLIYQNWNKELIFSEYLDLLNRDDSDNNRLMDYYKQCYKIYKGTKKIGKMDFHPYNLGFKGNKLVLFDICNISKRTRKFNDCPIIK